MFGIYWGEIIDTQQHGTMRLFLVLMCSVSRKDRSEYTALSHLEKTSQVESVRLFGDCPEQYFSKVVCFSLRKTVYHKAYSLTSEKYKPVRFNCPKGSWCGTDPMPRVLWRTKLSLDMLSVLMYANQNLLQYSEFVWLENDVKFLPEKIPPNAKAPFSCWGRTGDYHGNTSRCFIFKNDDTLLELIRCIIAKHTIMPVDWIIADCISMRQYDASFHLGSISTRVQ